MHEYKGVMAGVGAVQSKEVQALGAGHGWNETPVGWLLRTDYKQGFFITNKQELDLIEWLLYNYIALWQLNYYKTVAS